MKDEKFKVGDLVFLEHLYGVVTKVVETSAQDRAITFYHVKSGSLNLVRLGKQLTPTCKVLQAIYAESK